MRAEKPEHETQNSKANYNILNKQVELSICCRAADMNKRVYWKQVKFMDFVVDR